jgi:two-component system NarL family sensor kinase
VVALEESIENLKKTSDLRISLHYEKLPVISQDRLVNIYRMLQEIIHNTIKHSGATNLVINLDAEDNKLEIVTIDNGKGFDYRMKLKENKGLGLRNLYSRTEILGGNMYLDSADGKGVKFTFEIPN